MAVEIACLQKALRLLHGDDAGVAAEGLLLNAKTHPEREVLRSVVELLATTVR
jgi:hypothetical protein